jgi:hypothetical protein
MTQLATNQTDPQSKGGTISWVPIDDTLEDGQQIKKEATNKRNQLFKAKLLTAETRELTGEEHDLLAQSRDQLATLLRGEEIRYYWRAKMKDILLGDCNTRYFQMVVNGKKRNKKIVSLDHDQIKERLKAMITSKKI